MRTLARGRSKDEFLEAGDSCVGEGICDGSGVGSGEGSGDEEIDRRRGWTYRNRMGLGRYSDPIVTSLRGGNLNRHFGKKID